MTGKELAQAASNWFRTLGRWPQERPSHLLNQNVDARRLPRGADRTCASRPREQQRVASTFAEGVRSGDPARALAPDLQTTRCSHRGCREDMAHMNLIDQYFERREQLFEYFGYQEDWAKIPLADRRNATWWYLTGEGHGDKIVFGYEDLRENLADGEYYSSDIYTQRHLPKWVYRTEKYTLVCVDTHCDLNRLLEVFDNANEVQDANLIQLLKDEAL